jgi:hypothetical protein
MSYRIETEQYYAQLEDGIAEMEAMIERLRKEIHELTEIKDALLDVNFLLKKDLIDLL